MAYINTVDYAAWHIPCYANSNCPKRFVDDDEAEDTDNAKPDHQMGGVDIPVEIFTAGHDGATGDAELVSAFVWVLALASVAGIAVVVPALCTRGGHRRPLNLFLLSLAASDAVMALVVMPLHAVHTSVAAMTGSVCSAWMYAHLTAVCARSWSSPAAVLLHYLHDGLVPPVQEAAVLAWVWLASCLLLVPAVVARESFMELETCAVVVENVPMIVYVSVMAFFLPACVLAPAFIRWSQLRTKFNANEFNSTEVLDDNRAEEDRPGWCLGKHSGGTVTDRAFPGALYTFSLTHAAFWLPFFVSMLAVPFLADPIPKEVGLVIVSLGYAQTVLTPVLVWFLCDRIARIIVRALSCPKRNEAEEEEECSAMVVAQNAEGTIS